MKYRTKLEKYLIAMHQAKRMLTMGILTSEDYIEIDTIIANKHGISLGSIYRFNALLLAEHDGNM